MDEAYDVAIIGGGPGGYSTALRAAELGLKVALIERDATLGGTCLNRGCIPSKALISATHTLDSIRYGRELGISATIEGVDYEALHDYKQRIVDTMTKGLAGLLAHRGVTVYRGEGSVADATGRPFRVRISAQSGGDDQDAHGEPSVVERFVRSEVAEKLTADVDITARHVVLAMGSAPRPLPGTPFHGAIIDSTRALAMAIPHNAVIVGAGAIAVEFASMWNAAGCKVTMLIRKDRVLSAWDRRSGVTLTRELRRHGIDIIDHANVTRIDTGVNMGAVVHYQRTPGTSDGSTAEQYTTGEFVLVAIGRDPLTDAPWLKDAGVRVDENGFVGTDDLGRTAVDGIWASGDITTGPALAHRAFEQGIVIAEAIAGLSPAPVDDTTIPEVVFSNPEAASVGLTLAQARARDDISEPKETVYPMLSNARMMMSGSGGSLSLVSGVYSDRPDTPVVLGVHIVAPVASDIIAEAEQLVGNRIALRDAARLIHPHPTFSETLGETLLKADGRPLHTR
ncbi:FAD-dependent oxidoreductase [Bifidobacterium leontopitheci]|uniref:Dihydrolipoamide dehydrogenase n=1 Tax=Bifidobacterium leontopitheci TaxID=2650774 RepID=A0A6I1GIL1_9BIFI|nr:FAD-dependent oxidoreductase [Bifidobacterium leontopitheci]KAB7791474.1 dihydrolipoamide dehydrogenase [Bifidobacterium leontopitheci]